MTHFCSHKDIVVKNRTRREFDPALLNTLRESIEANGLLHAPVMRKDNGNLVLVAGERRLRAITDIYELSGTFRYNGTVVTPGMIPYTLVGELSLVEALEAEIEENAVRADLTWQEKADADARLMSLRSQQADLRGEPAPTVKEIAVEVRGSGEGRYLDETRKNIILSKHLADPDIKVAKTRDDAWRILKKKEDAKRNALIAARLGPEVVSAAHTCLHCDSTTWMAEAEAEQFEVILTDPPYGMGADEFGDSGTGTPQEHGYKDDLASWQDLMLRALPETFRLAAPKAHMYLFCDFDRFHDLKGMCELVGWRVHRTPLMWVKPSGFRQPWPGIGPQRKYELILFAVKGDRPCTTVKGDVIECGLDPALGWLAQKPVELYVDLLQRSVHTPGTRVLDWCCGSGPIFPAAHKLKCFATGLERDATAYGIAAKRVEDIKKESGL